MKYITLVIGLMVVGLLSVGCLTPEQDQAALNVGTDSAWKTSMSF